MAEGQAERLARQRLEMWADGETNVSLTYVARVPRSPTDAWNITVTVKEQAPIDSIIIEASARYIEGACEWAIEALGEYGIDVP